MMETSSHLSESKLLQHLLREAVNDGSSSIDEENGLDHEREVSTDNQLQSMIENYQQHVLKQKQHYQPNHYNAGPSNGHDHLKVNGGSIDGPVRVRINKTNGSTSVATPSTISHSQPCLYVTEQKYEYVVKLPNGNSYLHYPHSSDPRDHHQENGPTVLSNSIDMNALRAENIFLKQQVELLQKNTKILRSLELSFERINQAFSQAVLDREKQERLEQTIRFKMEQQLQRLTNENECLQKQVEKLNLLVVQQPVDTENLLHYNRLMTDLLPQNKELLAIKERQNLEIEAQNATLEEQRNHIEMLDKALSNAQERLAAKERAAVDAAALIDKCSHQQKLLQEVMDEKKRQQEDNERQKSSMEKEPIDAEELVRLRKNVQSKDERIEHLESNVVDIQKRFNDEKQRSEATTRTEVEALLSKIRGLEKDKADKDGRIHDLMEDKQRIHNQWANERHAFDQHMKLAALRQNDGQFNGFFSSNQSSTTSTEGQIGRPTSARAAVFHDPTLQQMEDIRQRLAERRAAPNNTANWMNRAARNGPPIHTRSASGSALSDYSSMNATISTHPPSNTAIVSLVNPIGHHSSASSVDSTTNSSDSISPSNGRTSCFCKSPFVHNNSQHHLECAFFVTSSKSNKSNGF
ncbi:hypothetical protein M3Y97_00277400 [Aphelenchoides bicaudatus]|nr:hypothetical protein M3Y97_00277400 [Aphelenchoides bicaudatus]